MQTKFKVEATGVIYDILPLSTNTVLIVEKDRINCQEWDISEVEKNFQSGAWIKVEGKQPYFSIKEDAIESAARFIIANNKYMHNHNVLTMTANIKSTVKKMIEQIKAGKDSWYSATAGYVIMIHLADEEAKYYEVEILVDTTVSQDKDFVNVEDVL